MAAVVNVSQYVLGKGLSYILGADENTTDIYGHVFFNRKVKESQLYFFEYFHLIVHLRYEVFKYLATSYKLFLTEWIVHYN